MKFRKPRKLNEIKPRLSVPASALLALALVTSSCSSSLSSPSAHVERVSGGPTGSYIVPPGIHKIKHIVVIMQENRSFDSYFGTFPGADGIPTKNGAPTVCATNPKTGQCVAPYVDHADVNGGGPHAAANATADVNGGQMNGFIAQAELGRRGCLNPNNPTCTNSASPDVMGFHTQSDIPNYWTYAKDFVLQDHMFEPNASWSLPAHLFLVSEWSAYCTEVDNPSSCVNALNAQRPEVPLRSPAVYGGTAGPKRAGKNGLVSGQPDYCLLYTSPSPRDGLLSRMPSSA